MAKKRNSFDSGKFVLSLSFLVLGFMLITGFHPKQLIVDRSNDTQKEDSSDLVRAKGFSDNHEVVNQPIRILIPVVSIDLDIRPAKVVSGYWEVFEDSAGWGEGSGVPGKVGNQVIFAHAREGLFLPLSNLKKGDLIYILTDSNWYPYKVEEIKEVYPNEIEEIAPTQDETLTLYTCSGYADVKRLLVVAKPVTD